MALSSEEIEQIAKATANEVVAALEELDEAVTSRDLLVGMVVGEGAIPVHGREHRKEVCYGCRIDPSKPLEAGNVMATTKDAIGILSAQEVRDLCSEIIETPDGRCNRARGIREAAKACKEKYPNDPAAYFGCFIPKFRATTEVLPSEKGRRCARCGKTKGVKYRAGTGLWLCDECFTLWPQPSESPESHH